ncbi:hypothetical protein [Shewanella algae]|uniref:hypothetical protein n=1 Tax=Shewanella algae TaxID=38313 RepID=UPI0012FF4718|nr:hypothetical protein [Shewanella algae]MBO2639067.1 hypothetical protein [Shewanella algae]MBO2643258.1 hypothetical protein [Shewanella algae]
MKVNTVLKVGIIAAMFSGAAMAANPTKTLVWTGFVPSGQPGTDMIITGLAGQENIAKGSLNINEDGTFTSSTVTVESHVYEPTNKTIGELVDAKWTLASAEVLMGDTDLSTATLVVKGNDSDWVVGQELTGAATNTVRVNIAQTTALIGVSGAAAQASVTLVAAKDAGVTP